MRSSPQSSHRSTWPPSADVAGVDRGHDPTLTLDRCRRARRESFAVATEDVRHLERGLMCAGSLGGITTR